MKALVYGRGKFFTSYRKRIEKLYEIVGIIDKKDNNIEKLLFDYSEKYDAVLVMIERIDILFEAIDILKKNNIPHHKILLGIGYFGKYRDVVHPTLSGKYGVTLFVDEDITVYSHEEYEKGIKKIIIPMLEKKGERVKNNLCEIYETIYELYWSGVNSTLSYNLECELFYRFHKYGSFGYGIIAVYNLRAIYQFEKPYVLDLGCADGFYYKYFYSKVKNIKYIGCDIDDYSIEKAKLNNINNPSAEFIVRDFCKMMPEPKEERCFTNIFWNESIQMFESVKQREILTEIKKRIGDKGVLSGTAHLEDVTQQEWKYCINAFKNVKQIKELLEAYFKNVFVYNDLGMNRTAVFMASDSRLFFSD